MRDWSRGHIEAIAEIDCQSFLNPWQIGTYREELFRPEALHRVALDRGGQVVGFACSRLLLDELHVLKVAVATQHRRQGIGSELMNALFLSARQRGAGEVLLEVRPSNLGGLSLYRKLKFHRIAVRSNYYPDTGEDAWVLQKSLKEDS